MTFNGDLLLMFDWSLSPLSSFLPDYLFNSSISQQSTVNNQHQKIVDLRIEERGKVVCNMSNRLLGSKWRVAAHVIKCVHLLASSFAFQRQGVEMRG